MVISSERLAPSGLELALLGFLREQPAHAYELFQRMDQAGTLGQVWRLKQSHLYALLGRLEAAGYLAGDLVRQGARPPRRVLALTPKGRAAFDEWVMTPVARGRDFRQEFLAKLYFAASDTPTAACQLVERQRAASQQWLDAQREREEPIAKDQPYAALVLRFRMSQIEAILDWLGECLDTFTAGQTDRP